MCWQQSRRLAQGLLKGGAAVTPSCPECTRRGAGGGRLSGVLGLNSWADSGGSRERWLWSMWREGPRASSGRVRLRELVRLEEGMMKRPLPLSLEFRVEGWGSGFDFQNSTVLSDQDFGFARGASGSLIRMMRKIQNQTNVLSESIVCKKKC